MWKRVSPRKPVVTTQELLNSIKVDVSFFLKTWFHYNDLSEQYTKKGPGRKHKEIKRDDKGIPLTKWVPRTVEWGGRHPDNNQYRRV